MNEPLASLLDKLRSGGAPDPSMAGRRAAFEQLSDWLLPSIENVVVHPVTAGGVTAEWVAAGESGPAAIFYLHGGGFTLGSPRTHRDLIGRLSRATGLRALSVDYRLAPEHPFPAGLEDAAAAYGWLLAEVGDAGKIILAGDSAGAAYLSLLVLLRDRGVALPKAAMLISPWTDLVLTGRSLDANAPTDPLVQRQSAAASVGRYLGPEGDRKDPLASPLYADLRGLPPLLIQVGLDESLLDDSLRLAARARRSGVPVSLDVWEGMIHIWPFFAKILPEGQAAIDAMGAFAREHLAVR